MRKVRVIGRDDIGEVVSEGVNIGVRPSVYCASVHFPSTGEVAYYDKAGVDTVEA